MNLNTMVIWLRVLMVLAALILLGSVVSLVYRGLERGPVEEVTPAPLTAAPTAAPKTFEPDDENMYESWDSLSFANMDGAKVSLQDLEGDVKVLYFFASYCPYCKEELAQSEQFARAVAAAGNASMYLVDRADGEKETRRDGISYYQQEGFPFPMLFDDGRVAFDRLGLGVIPAALFFDGDNRLTSYAIGATLTPQALKAHLAYAQEGGEVPTKAFVTGHLMGEDGGVRSLYRSDEREVLSESQGLLMEYAVQGDDQALFDRAYGYALKNRDECGLFSWRVTGEQPTDINATLDDLRILNALMDAKERWGGYDDDIDVLSSAIINYCAPGRMLRDYYDWNAGAVAETLSLCYVDVRTLEKLAEGENVWRAVYDNAVALLKDGAISDDFPLYYPKYDYATGKYGGEELHSAEAMLTLIQLARIDALPEQAREYVMERLKEEGIYARYSIDGNVLNGYRYESTAVYALTLLLAKELEDPEMERLSLARMEKMRIFDVSTPMNGAYGMRSGVDMYAFDQLMALLAWQMISDD